MQRLYKFFILLFIALFVISFIYGTLVSWGLFSLMKASDKSGIRFQPVPASAYLWAGLMQAITYSLVQLTSLVFLFRLAYQQERKFTIQHILSYITWFLIITTVIFVIYFVWFTLSGNIASLLLVAGPKFSLPGTLWFPFPLAWIALYILLAARIKNNPANGR
ncbi:MAG: hypothetical protein JNM88_01070 [Chitinophagaceae bacterium]|nr:hypothetical protein [Chitinophagaceae bacterium]